MNMSHYVPPRQLYHLTPGMDLCADVLTSPSNKGVFRELQPHLDRRKGTAKPIAVKI